MTAIVVLGAADGSLTTYRAVREMGFRAIAVDRSSAAPGVGLADEFLPLSTRDVPAILAALAGRRDLAGVVAPPATSRCPPSGS